MKPFSAQKYGALRQRSTSLSCEQHRPDPPGLLATDDRVGNYSHGSSEKRWKMEPPSNCSCRWLVEFVLLYVVGALHLYVFPSFRFERIV